MIVYALDDLGSILCRSRNSSHCHTQPPIKLGTFHEEKLAKDRSHHSLPPSTELGIRGTIPPLNYTSVLSLGVLMWQKYFRLNWIFINLKGECSNSRRFTVLYVFLNNGRIMNLNICRDKNQNGTSLPKCWQLSNKIHGSITQKTASESCRLKRTLFFLMITAGNLG
jgi:hypothetical protein